MEIFFPAAFSFLKSVIFNVFTHNAIDWISERAPLTIHQLDEASIQLLVRFAVQGLQILLYG